MKRRWLVLWVLLSACEAKTRHVNATQVVVRIDAAAEIRQKAARLRVRAAVQDAPEAAWSERPVFELPIGQLKAGQKDFWPVDIPVSPRESAAPPWLFELVIEALSSAGEPLVQTRVLTGFVTESERMLTVTLEACGALPLGKVCETDAMCHGPSCQSCQQGSCTDTTEMILTEMLARLDRKPITSAQLTDAGPGEGGVAGGDAPGGRGAEGGRGPAAGSGGTEAEAGHAGMPPVVVTSVEAWSMPERVDMGQSAVSVPVAASNAAGDTVIIYRQDDSSGFFWLRRFVHGAWDAAAFAPNGLVPGATQRLLGASPGIDSSGAAQLLYEDGQPKTLWLRWTGEKSLPEAAPPLVLGDQSLADMPNLAVTEDGSALAVWVASSAESGTTARTVYLNRRERDTWQSPNKIGDTGATPRSSGFCANAGGDFVAVFAAQDTASNGAPGPSILKSFVGAGDNISAANVFQLQGPTLPSGFPCALDHAGNATLVFLAGADSEHTQLYASRLATGSTMWSEPASLSERIVVTGQIIADADEAAIAIWQEHSAADAKKSRIVARRYESPNGWGEREEISEAFESRAESLELARTPKGELIAVWTEPHADAKVLRVSRSSATNMWSAPRDLAEVAADAQIVKLTVDPDNRALIVWGQTPKSGVAQLMWSRSSWSTSE